MCFTDQRTLNSALGIGVRWRPERATNKPRRVPLEYNPAKSTRTADKNCHTEVKSQSQRLQIGPLSPQIPGFGS